MKNCVGNGTFKEIREEDERKPQRHGDSETTAESFAETKSVCHLDQYQVNNS